MKMLQFSRTLLSIGADRAVYLKGLADKPGNGNVNCSGKTNRRYQMGTISILFPNQIFYCCSFNWFDNASARIGRDTFHSKPLDFRFYRCALFYLLSISWYLFIWSEQLFFNFLIVCEFGNDSWPEDSVYFYECSKL